MTGPVVTRIADQTLSDRIGHGDSGSWSADGVNEISGQADRRMPDAMTLETGDHDKYIRSFDTNGTPGDIKQMISTPDGMQYQPWNAAAHPGIDRKFDVALNGFQQQAKGIQPLVKNDVAAPLQSMAKMTGLRQNVPPVEPPRDMPTAAKPEPVAAADFEIGFNKGSSHLVAKNDAAIMREAQKIKAALGRGGHAQLRLMGTADNTAFKSDSYEKNQAIADQRVDAVQAELDKDLKKLGVDPGKVEVTKATQLNQAHRVTKGSLSITP